MFEQLKSLLGYKELLFNFAKKELKLKYKNSVLGFFWSLLNPILMMLVFSLIFVVFFKTGVPNFYIFFLAGLLPWNFFNATVMGGTASIISNASLVKKVYFPRELLPLSVALANLINFFLELLVFLLFIIATGIFAPGFFAVFKYLPYLLIMLPILFLFAVGFSFLVAALNVYFRDIQHIVGILMMILFYVSPIIYNIYPIKGVNGVVPGYVPPEYLSIYLSNPLAAIILSFKNALYFMQPPQLNWVLYSAAAAALSFLIGYTVFFRLSPFFAEEL